jgi:hypothetical protein
MNDAVDISPTKRRFSAAACLATALFHFIVTLVIVGYYIGAILARFYEDTSFEVAFWRGLLWLWTPLAMALGGLEAWNNSVFVSACIWPCVFGIFVGFLTPAIVRWIQRRFATAAAMQEQDSNVRAGVMFRAFGRLYSLGWKRKTVNLIVSTVIIMEMFLGGWLYYYRFFTHSRGFTFRDLYKFRPFASAAKQASTFTLYEGLPHQFWDSKKLEEELANKRTIRITRFAFPFYERPLSISSEDIEALRHLATSSDSFLSYGGPKLCGGYHPDYALAWSDGTSTSYLLICFGCHEMFFDDGKHAFWADIRDEAAERFWSILHQYHDQRPRGE